MNVALFAVQSKWARSWSSVLKGGKLTFPAFQMHPTITFAPSLIALGIVFMPVQRYIADVLGTLGPATCDLALVGSSSYSMEIS